MKSFFGPSIAPPDARGAFDYEACRDAMTVAFCGIAIKRWPRSMTGSEYELATVLEAAISVGWDIDVVEGSLAALIRRWGDEMKSRANHESTSGER